MSRRLKPDSDISGLTDASSGGRLMTWSASLNIYRVNRSVGSHDLYCKKHLRHRLMYRFNPPEELDRRRRRWLGEEDAGPPKAFDFVEQLLMRNMVDAVENIFEHVGLETVQVVNN